MQQKIDQLRDHVILCGFGRMGTITARMLTEKGADVVVVEFNESVRAELDAAGMLYVLGDATEEETLIAVGLQRARALVSALAGDADNVYVTLTARGLSPTLHIVSRAEQPTTEAKLRRAGADRVICPQVIGATRVADILMRPHVVDFFEVAARGVDLELDEYTIGSDSVLKDVKLRDSGLRQKTGAMVVVVKRSDGTSVFQPGPDEVLREGDQLILVGRAGTSARLDSLNA